MCNPPGEPPAHQRRQAAQSGWLEGASPLGQLYSSTGHWDEISYTPKCPGTHPTFTLETSPWVSLQEPHPGAHQGRWEASSIVIPTYI